MAINVKFAGIVVVVQLIALLQGCGSSGGDASIPAATTSQSNLPPPQSNVANTVPITVTNSVYGEVNTPYISITLCSPDNSSNCQTIDHILLDTGSAGLRVYASALNASLTLQALSDGSGNALAECMQFSEGYMWGPLRSVSLQMADERADNLAMQVVADQNFQAIPASCSATGRALDTPQAFGANGVFGVGLFNQDCGSYCTQSNDIYFGCGTQGCTGTALALNAQIQNPVSMFGTNNNGTIISLDSISGSVAAVSVAGVLTFGVDTQTNNASANTYTLTADPSTGYISTNVSGQIYSAGFIDTGSNAILFNPPDNSLLFCTNAPWFFCPAATVQFTVANVGINNVSAQLEFGAANALSLFAAYPGYAAFAGLTGPAASDDAFDWGIPFYFGKNVYTVIEGGVTRRGTGPYFGW